MSVYPDRNRSRLKRTSPARRAEPASAKRFRWILSEQRMIVMREAPQLDEAVLNSDLRDRRRGRVTLPQDGVNGTKPLVTQIGYRSQTENVIKGAMQGPS